MPPPGLAVGVDIGGTKLAAGLVAGDGTVVTRLRRETPADDVVAITRTIVEVVAEIRSEHGLDPVPVGVGAAGIIDLGGTVRYAPNLAWRDHPLRAELEDALGVRVTVDNDANVAAWGEFRCGAGAAARASLALLTIGTGVGGGLVLDGQLVRGANGFAAEFGHIVVSEGGPVCPCGNRGCLEVLASGTAIGRTAADLLAAGEVPDGSPLHQQPPTGKSVTVAAHAGDEAATEVLRRCGTWLGVGIASLVNALDPEIVVLGGGAMQAGDLLLRPALQAAAARIMGRGYRPPTPVVRATLADDAGLVGAALLALDATRAAPQTPAG